jgi:hypothetical protein
MDNNSVNQQQQQEPQPQPQLGSAATIILVVFLIVWFIISIWAIIKSLLCTGKSGTTAEKVLGIVIAFFLGPFYFLYLYANKNYCLDEAALPPAEPQVAFGGRKHK